MNEQTKHYENKLKFEMDSSDLNEALKNTPEKFVVIDTRKLVAYHKEHIPGSKNFPHLEMTLDSTQSLDKTKTYVCYCDGIGCNASTKGALKLAQLGFKVKELIGGLDWWKRDGYATSLNTSDKEVLNQCSC